MICALSLSEKSATSLVSTVSGSLSVIHSRNPAWLAATQAAVSRNCGNTLSEEGSTTKFLNCSTENLVSIMKREAKYSATVLCVHP